MHPASATASRDAAIRWRKNQRPARIDSCASRLARPGRPGSKACAGALGDHSRLGRGVAADCYGRNSTGSSGSASDSRVSNLAAGKLPPKLNDRIADVRGRRWPTQTGHPADEVDNGKAAARVSCHVSVGFTHTGPATTVFQEESNTYGFGTSLAYDLLTNSARPDSIHSRNLWNTDETYQDHADRYGAFRG